MKWLPDMIKGAEEVLADEAKRATADYWAELAAEDRALGLHAHADEIAYHDTDAGMWEEGE